MDKILNILIILIIISIPFTGESIGLYLNTYSSMFFLKNIFLLFLGLSIIFFIIQTIYKKRNIVIPNFTYQFVSIVGITILYLFFQKTITDQTFALLFMLTLGLLIYFTIYGYADSRKRISYIIIVLFFVFATQGILAVFQFFNPKIVSNPIVVQLGNDYVTRADGMINHPGPFGVFLALIWPLAFTDIIFSKQRNKWVLYFKMLTLICGSFGVIFSLTRSAWIGLFVSLMFIVIYTGKLNFFRKKIIMKVILIIFIFLLLISIFFSIRFFKDRFLASDMCRQISFRLYLNKIAFEMIRDYPVFGIGVGNFKTAIENYTLRLKRNVHNEYLYWLSEYGITGFLIFIWFIISILKGAYIIMKKCQNTLFFPLVLGINSMIWSLLIINNSGLAMSHVPIFFLFCIMLALLSAVNNIISMTEN